MNQVLIGNVGAMAHRSQLRVVKDPRWQPLVVLNRTDPNVMEMQKPIEEVSIRSNDHAEMTSSEDPPSEVIKPNRKRKHNNVQGDKEDSKIQEEYPRRSKRARKMKRLSEFCYD